jgi:hypothetical protein
VVVVVVGVPVGVVVAGVVSVKVPVSALVPTVRLSVATSRLLSAFPRSARMTTVAATTATAKPRRAAQTQSPGYHGIRRRHAPRSAAVARAEPDSGSPHSRQYSWPAV